MLDELRVSSELLRLALDHYLNACLAIKRSPAGYPPMGQPQPDDYDSTNLIVMNQIPLLAEYDLKLRESKAAILQYRNLYSHVAPASKLPVDILVRIFQQLVEDEHEVALSTDKDTIINRYPITLAHICSNWRWVVLHSPLLWTYISLTCNKQTHDQRVAHIDLHSRYSQQAPVKIFIDNLFSIRTPDASYSTFVHPFTGRIDSLEIRLESHQVSNGRAKASYLIAQCLDASNYALKRLAIHMDGEVGGYPFIESISCPTNLELVGLVLYMSHDRLEDTLSPITDLQLRGRYFNWDSNAYRGLITLKLEATGSDSISELHLTKILVSSPQLQYLAVGLEIIERNTHPSPICLPQLEVLTGSVSLLHLIRPGLKKLSASLEGPSREDSDLINSTRIKDFLSRADTTRLYSNGWLSSTSDVCGLLFIAPGIRALALSNMSLSGTLPDVPSHPSLDVLYLLGKCELEKPLLRDMAARWNIKKLVFWGVNSIVHSSTVSIQSNQGLKEELFDLGDTVLEFVSPPSEDALPLDFFLSRPNA